MPASRKESTRQRLIREAHAQFAEKGFYGTSIADISDALGLTKQTLLHHFGSKEKLYAEVLQRITDRFRRQISSAQTETDHPLELFERLMLDRMRDNENESTRIVTRELMDNVLRPARTGQWYLKPWLETLVDLLLDIPAAKQWRREEALAFVSQILGAISHMAISGPTLRNLLGARRYNAMARAYPEQLRALIRARLGVC